MGFYQVHFKGIVQGVGFRPFIKNLADEHSLLGEVYNTSDGVIAKISCSKDELDFFLSEFKRRLPPLAHVISIEIEEVDNTTTYTSFSISKSIGKQGVTPVSPDIATCNDCMAEISDSNERRYEYAFTNCTNCGARYSIIESLPYDRKNTVMTEFEMCDDCHEQYSNQLDRRYHAQPIACEVCGPKAYINHDNNYLEATDAIKYVANKIDDGEIVAIKGLGGYHIICDATNDMAVQKLKQLKNRGTKPFAVMCESIDSIHEYTTTEQKFDDLFSSSESPIVIFDWHNHPLSKDINSVSNKIGIMRAYTPLHLILFKYLKTKFIVATSGNAKDEPIASDEATAEQALSQYTNIFLHHNRKIHTAIDDSVIALTKRDYTIIRRARGYAPFPVMIKSNCDKQIFAAGANLKSSIALYKDGYAFLSQYIGDLDNIETENFYSEIYDKMCSMFAITPELAIKDMHPTYRSSTFADELKLGAETIQHHKAHFMSCLAENSHYGDAIGVVMDGFGLGDDDDAWGGEFFVKIGSDISRVAHIKKYIQAGLDSSTKHPVRMAFSYIYSMGLLDSAKHYLVNELNMTENEMSLLKYAIDNNVNSIETSSAGRLFEAIGSIVLKQRTNSYEGELAINLEAIADRSITDSYNFEFTNNNIDFKNVIINLLHDIESSVPVSIISAKFHNGFANIVADACLQIADNNAINVVALSGGVMQNVLLLDMVVEKLEDKNITVLTHKKIPANDGGIALGQIYSIVR